MLFFGIKKTVRLNKKKTKEFPLGNSLVHTVISVVFGWVRLGGHALLLLWERIKNRTASVYDFSVWLMLFVHACMISGKLKD